MRYRYYGKDSHAAADLIATMRRVRRNAPEMFDARRAERSREDGTIERVWIEPKAAATAADLHRHATRAPWGRK